VLSKVKDHFFSLNRDSLAALLQQYGHQHGKNAETYAIKTFNDWKNGTTGLSGQTLERLLQLVPMYLNATQRLELLKQVVSHNRPTQKERLTVNISSSSPDEGFQQLYEKIGKATNSDQLANIPKNTMDAAAWLYDDDITVARAMLAKIIQAEDQVKKGSALAEAQMLERTVRSGQVSRATQSFEFSKCSVTASVNNSSCFIATAVFGDPMHPHVVTLRLFRDEILNTSSAGMRIVDWYYENGETMSQWIKQSQILTCLFRLTLSCFSKFYATVRQTIQLKGSNNGK